MPSDAAAGSNDIRDQISPKSFGLDRYLSSVAFPAPSFRTVIGALKRRWLVVNKSRRRERRPRPQEVVHPRKLGNRLPKMLREGTKPNKTNRLPLSSGFFRLRRC
jgi:hypothetical protein